MGGLGSEQAELLETVATKPVAQYLSADTAYTPLQSLHSLQVSCHACYKCIQLEFSKALAPSLVHIDTCSRLLAPV